MENLPTEKQLTTSFALPSKKPDRLKFFLFLGLGLVILVLIGEGVYYWKIKREKKALETSVIITLIPAEPSRLQLIIKHAS